MRERVTTVGDRVEDQVGNSLLGCQFDAGLKVLPAGVNATIGFTSALVREPQREWGLIATITAIALTTRAKVPGVDAAKFAEIANETKKTCPVSRALGAIPKITVDAQLA